ncbi:GerAB/ArcD/ProY family transporter [Paenibacillus hamazuiensis]|uniref:GerAB/ArcD/ProY family transporter n=1 Tax=Paenibacillus hamazuiensis TaxID=2936508 RepID=UPI00200DE16B|nr:GerAB/ArcD/ProY family transporter [Paenibacillus hamazuiensis]
METISKYQIAAMVVLFEIGSTPLFELGIKAEQDAWLAMLAAAIAGFLLTWVFLFIQKQDPVRNLAEMLESVCGRFLGKMLTVGYALYFAYEAMRNVRDFGELTTLTMLTLTPKSLIMGIVVILSVYAAVSGIEVLFRVGETFFLLFAGSYAVMFVLLLSGGLPEPDRLKPVLHGGIMPVLRAAFPDILSFPFGQTVVFLMFWSAVRHREKLHKHVLAAYAGVAVLLVSFNALNMAVLGPELAKVSTIPLLASVQLIQIKEVLERLDLLVTIILFLGLFFKITCFLLGGALCIKQAVRCSAGKAIVFTGAVVYITSFLEPNYTYHIWLGLEYSVKIFPLFQVVLPAILLAAMLWKNRRRGKYQHQ